jgi:hypothetical protein
MLTMHISASETPTQTATNTGSADGLAACLAQHGVAPQVIQSALAALAQGKTLVLYRPTEADAWALADAPRPTALPVAGVG